MVILEDYLLDGRQVRIGEATFKDWWLLQQRFAGGPFYEFFDTDKLLEYYDEFKDGKVYKLEIICEQKMSDGDNGLPVALLSWPPMELGAHPVEFPQNVKLAYISDAGTFEGYERKGAQKRLFTHAMEEMRQMGYDVVYLRSSFDSTLPYLLRSLGFTQIEGASQKVTSMRVGGAMKSDDRVFFYRKL